MTIRHSGSGWLLLYTLLTTPALTAAQQGAERIQIGTQVSAVLDENSPRLVDGPFRSYTFAGQAGVTYEIELRTTGFEPFIQVGRSIAGVTDYLVAGGYHGLGDAALVTFTAAASEPFLVVARSADGELGSFQLIVREQTPAPSRRELEMDDPVVSVLETEALHTFRGTAGQEVMITARSIDFDTMLEIGRLGTAGFVSLSADDDGAGGTDSRVYFTPESNGEYVARVTPYSGGAGGGYAVLLSIPPILPDPSPLAPDVPAGGELSDATPRLEDDLPFADWALVADPGSRFRIDLQSTEFDTRLSVGRLEGRRFIELASNDDAGDSDLGDTDSRLVFVVREPGPHIVRVQPFSEDGRGRYTLIASGLPPALLEPAGGVIQSGSAVIGEVTDGDAVLADGTPYQEWRITATGEERLEVVLSSNAFDTYVMAGTGSGDEMMVLAENDDSDTGANGTDSRLVFTPPAPGDYTILVRPYDATGRGAYSLRVQSAPPVLEQPVEGDVRIGQSVGGILREIDARLEGDMPYQVWYFDAIAGQSLVIDMISEEFDTYLAVGRLDAGEFVELQSNDDFGDGTNSQVRLVSPIDGRLVVHAAALFPEGSGAYRLEVKLAQ